MAKGKRKRTFQGGDHLTKVQRKKLAETLYSLFPAETDWEGGDLEIRFDLTQTSVKEKLELVNRYNLVRLRYHAGDEERIARVSITLEGAKLLRAYAKQRLRGVSSQIEALESTQRHELDKLLHQGGGVEPIPLPSREIALSTPTLRRFQERAREKGLSRIIAQEGLANLDPNALHSLNGAMLHTSSEGQRNARISLTLELKANPLTGQRESERSMCDILLSDFDALIAPYTQKKRQRGIERENEGVVYLTTPKWEATRSYATVHQIHSFYQGHVALANRGVSQSAISLPHSFGEWESGVRRILKGDEVDDFLTHPRTLMNADLAEYLHDAHPVVMDPEIVELQEEWSQIEAWAYGGRVVLPYDPLFLDFESAGGRYPSIDVYSNLSIDLTGCLFHTDRETGRLVVSPIGGRQTLDPLLGTNFVASGFAWEQMGRIVVGTGVPNGEAIFEGYPSSWFKVPINVGNLNGEATALNLMAPQRLREIHKEEPQATEELSSEIESIPANMDEYASPGYMLIPLRVEEADHPADAIKYGAISKEDTHDVWALHWTRVLSHFAAKALSMLSLLDNEHIEIREAEISRQVRRQAERKGSAIAKQVVVVRKFRYEKGGRKEVEGDHKIEYSHQFPVRRHEQHHGPHTPAYRAAPEKAKPCARCGSCRRFLVESYIKGDPDKPLVLNKTYVFKDKDEQAA